MDDSSTFVGGRSKAAAYLKLTGRVGENRGKHNSACRGGLFGPESGTRFESGGRHHARVAGASEPHSDISWLRLQTAWPPKGTGEGWWLLSGTPVRESGPLQNFSKHRAPDVGELQHTRIVDPRWVQVAISRIREREAFLETNRLGTRVPLPLHPADPNAPPGEERPPKESGRGSRKGKDKEKNNDKESTAK